MEFRFGLMVDRMKGDCKTGRPMGCICRSEFKMERS